MSILQVLQITLLLLIPYLVIRFTRRRGALQWLSPVVCCYIAGIGMRNLLGLPFSDELSMQVSQAAVLLALPLVLFSTDLHGWFRLARPTLIAFGFSILSVIFSVLICSSFFKGRFADVHQLGGMLAAVYIGGTPNMSAVSLGLGVPEERFLLLNAAEIAAGGMYLVFLTSVGPAFFSRFLPGFPGNKFYAESLTVEGRSGFLRDMMWAFLLTAAILIVSAGAVWFFQGNFRQPGLMVLLITVLSVLASLQKRIRNLKGTAATGDYLLLVFSVAIGLLADFSEMFTNGSWMVLFAMSVLIVQVFFHLLFCRLLSIDRDTMIITSVASIYGPPFIGQVAMVLKNRSVIFSGMATALTGIAVANFIGLGMAKLVPLVLDMVD